MGTTLLMIAPRGPHPLEGEGGLRYASGASFTSFTPFTSFTSFTFSITTRSR